MRYTDMVIYTDDTTVYSKIYQYISVNQINLEL